MVKHSEESSTTVMSGSHRNTYIGRTLLYVLQPIMKLDVSLI